MYNIIKYVELVIAGSFGIGCYDHESSLTGSPVVADEHEENFSNTATQSTYDNVDRLFVEGRGPVIDGSR